MSIDRRLPEKRSKVPPPEDWEDVRRRLHRQAKKKVRWERLCDMAKKHRQAELIREFLATLESQTIDDPKLKAKAKKLIRSVSADLKKLDPLSNGPAAVFRTLGKAVPVPDDDEVMWHAG